MNQVMLMMEQKQDRNTLKRINRLRMFQNYQSGDLSNAEWLEDRVVNIPSSVPTPKPG